VVSGVSSSRTNYRRSDEREDGFQLKINGTSYVPLTVVSNHKW
jgi:hypothetical protein